MGVKLWMQLVDVTRFLVKLAILTAWLYLVTSLPLVNVWLALAVWGLLMADFCLWLRHSSYCEVQRWFEWFPPGEGFYCWRQTRRRKGRG